MNDITTYFETLRETAQAAAALVLEGYRCAPSVNKKGRNDLVTEYDVAAERLVLERLARAHPKLLVIGEETHGRGAQAADQELVVYVDPIDGTTNFAHGHPFFCVSLGLCRGGIPLAGVIVAPALGVSWEGVVGREARRNGTPCHVSGESDLGEAFAATGFSYDVIGSSGDNVAEFKYIQEHVQGVRRCGSAALDLALVADGTYDFYWERGLSPWDVAAGAATVLAGGGQLSDYRGNAADVRSGTLLASNARLHRAAVNALSAVAAKEPG